MAIVIKELDPTNIQHVNQCDGTFRVDTILHLHAEEGRISYTPVSVPAYDKRYTSEHADYTRYLDDPDKTIFFAYLDGQLAGQIILRQNWNNFAYIEDITVDVKFRRQGIGKILISQAIDWAKRKKLPGLMLETQNNNLNACRFYERLGFQLAGFDRLLYQGLQPNTEEIALFWYLIF
jgi:ribosomal protein S18 acetylase RimI-like enzyme